MPRRKKLPKVPDYTGVPKDENRLIVQKSNPLQSLSETGLSLVEFKILDAYLSKIDSHNEEKRFVRFEKGELEKILGVSRILREDLDTRLDGLFKVVTIRDKHKNKGFTKIALFEKAEAKQDEDGLWQVDLACTPSAMEYIFNIEVMGYLPYMLKNIIELTSRYSYVLYLYLENRRKSRLSNSWEMPIEELKNMLRCNAESYKAYKEFNDKILKRCYKEINEKTTLRYTYEPTAKKGRKYTSIRFTIKSNEELIETKLAEQQLEDQMTFEEVVDEIDEDEIRLARYGGDENLAILAMAVNDEFCKEDMEQISIMLTKIDTPKDRNLSGFDAIIWGRQQYLREKYAALNAEVAKKARNGEKPIKSRVAYFKGMLEKEAQREEQK